MDILNWLRGSPMATWWFQEMGKCIQTCVCLSKLGQCVSKVHLSCWTRWQKPARIKEVGLWPTLTFSALSTRNESAPSSNALRDIGWAHRGERAMGCRAPSKRFPCGAPRSALASPHASTAHEQRGSTLVAAPDQGHYNCQQYTRKCFVICAL